MAERPQEVSMAQPRIVKLAEIAVVPRRSGVSTLPIGAALKLHKHNTEEMVVLLEGESTVAVGRHDTYAHSAGVWRHPHHADLRGHRRDRQAPGVRGPTLAGASG